MATPAPSGAWQYPVWRQEWISPGGITVHVRFVGRGGDRTRAETLAAVESPAPPVAALRQLHGATVVDVDAGGFHGDGDALVSDRRGLALSVITADCVPVLLAMGEGIAAVHAGWRGIVAGVVPAAIARLGGAAADAHAWLGPSIDACCYEVSDEVAAQVTAAAGVELPRPGRGNKPHVDLRAAVAAQLATAGVREVTLVGPCTRCHPELLWSYRREGKLAGRNIAYIWRQ